MMIMMILNNAILQKHRQVRHIPKISSIGVKIAEIRGGSTWKTSMLPRPLKRVLLGGRFVIEFEMKYNFLEILISILNKLFNWKVFQSWSNQNIVNFEENHLNGQSIGSYFKCKLSFRKIQ